MAASANGSKLIRRGLAMMGQGPAAHRPTPMAAPLQALALLLLLYCYWLLLLLAASSSADPPPRQVLAGT